MPQGNPFDQFDQPTASGPVAIPLPMTPEERRAESRDERAANRADAQLGLAAAANARAAEAAARAAANDGRTQSNTEFDNAASLRKEFRALPEVKEYQTVIRQYDSALKTQETPTGDQALITAYAKMLDPGSVVREQEFNVVAAGDSSLGKVVARIQKELGVDGGGLLRPEVRTRVRAEMRNLVNSYAESYDLARQDYGSIAQRAGYDPQDILGSDLAAPYQKAINEYWAKQTPENRLDAGPLASGDSAEKSIPIPPQMEREHQAYLQQNWGRINPDDYARFRAEQDRRYGFEPRPDAYRAVVPGLNDFAAQGGLPDKQNIPAVNAPMDGQDRINNTIFNSPGGAALLGAGSLGGGMDEVVGLSRAAFKGTNLGVEIARANAMRGAAADAYPISTIAGNIAGAALTGYSAGAALPISAVSTMPRALGAGAVFGGVSGALEGNDDRLLGAGLGAGAGVAGGYLGQKAGLLGEAITRRLSKNVPQLTGAERTISDISGPIDNVRTNLQQAADLNLPYSLADADPKLRSLAGAVSRRSVNARELAEQTFEPRARGQADRAIEAIEGLAPRTDIQARQGQIIEQGRPVYSPLYERAYAAPPVTSDEIESLLRTPAGRGATGRARTIAANERRNPEAMGFAVDEAGNTVLNPPPVAQMDRLDAARQGWDAAKQAYDDALARKRASLVPTTQTKGVQEAEAALKAAERELEDAKAGFLVTPKSGTIQDRQAYTTQSLDYVKRGLDDILEESRSPVTGRLELDEAGRAINGVRADLLNELDSVNPDYGLAREAYGRFAKQAEALTTGQRLASTAMPQRDFDTIIGRATEYDAALPSGWGGNATLPEMRRGYATAMGDQVDKMRLSGNPYEAVYGSPQQRGKIGTLFPEGADRFGKVYGMERDMAKTAHETLGGSPTAQRLQADAQISDITGAGLEIGADVLAGGGASGLGALYGVARRALGDKMRLGVGAAGEKRAEQIAPILFNTNPREMLDAIDQYALRKAQINARQQSARKYGGLFGSFAVPALAVPSS